MKKLLFSLAALAASFTASADEGMWTIYDLPQAAFEQMQREGFQLSYDELYNGPQALRNCVVNFSGYCSGVVVSPDGLVFTNHHCGFEAIRSHSTVEHDYMLNGFFAKTYEEELPNENMFVSFMIEQKDITDEVYSKGYAYLSSEKRAVLVDSIENALNEEVKKENNTYHVEVDAFFERNKFYATTYQMFTDLRLVFTIPKSMGKFGGETDNWMWPRQTCDFSVFRIYADPETNGPADYSEKNVPYHPERWAKVSLDGYKDGDYAMTIGYPGSTSRYMSSYGIREMRDAENAPRAQIRGVKQDVMIKHMRADEAVRIKYDSKYAQSSNYWKNSLGMNKCIDSIGIITQKQEFETRLKKYQDETGCLVGCLDLDKLSKEYEKRFHAAKDLTLFAESFRRTTELTTRAMSALVHRVYTDDKRPNITFEDNSEEWDEALDRDVLAALIQNYAELVPAEERPSFYQIIDKRFKGDAKKYVDYLWKKSNLMKGKVYMDKKSLKKDPGLVLGASLIEKWNSIIDEYRSNLFEINEQERYLCEAKLRMEQDQPHYSDANFTMRLSYGTVGGYTIGGHRTSYYTTPESIVDKMNRAAEVIDYEAEPIMKELLSARDFGRYTDSTTGKMQLCFLTNNDITGGNSGSPMFDGKGQLIGLAFDGNWDSLASDINFDRDLARCIGVDIRYVLFMMDKWGHADRLIEEIFRK